MDRFDNIPETALAWHRDGQGAVLATVLETITTGAANGEVFTDMAPRCIHAWKLYNGGEPDSESNLNGGTQVASALEVLRGNCSCEPPTDALIDRPEQLSCLAALQQEADARKLQQDQNNAKFDDILISLRALEGKPRARRDDPHRSRSPRGENGENDDV